MGWSPGPPPPRRPGGKAGLVIGLLAGTLVLVAIAVGAVVYVLGQDDGSGGGAGATVSPRVGQIAGGAEARIDADGALIMARPGVERPVVDIYEDFACPPCGRFDKMHDPVLKTIAVAGQAKVVFHPMVIFASSAQPMHGNAVRAAAALRCVGDGARWLSYQDTLYDHQPASESTQAYSVTDLLSYGAPLGLTDPQFTSCVRNQTYAASVQTVSSRYISEGVQSTPSARVNGRTLTSSETSDPTAFRSAILAAR